MRNIPRILNYLAIFEPQTVGGFGVYFPDFPGCVTFGKNFEEAKAKAEEVLSLWLEEMAGRRQTIPYRSGRPLLGDISVPAPRNLKQAVA